MCELLLNLRNKILPYADLMRAIEVSDSGICSEVDKLLRAFGVLRPNVQCLEVEFNHEVLVERSFTLKPRLVRISAHERREGTERKGKK